MQFRHERLDDDPPNTEHMICLTTDLTGNRRDDVIVGATTPGSAATGPSPRTWGRRRGTRS